MFFQRKSRPAGRAVRAQRRRHEFRVSLARQSLRPQVETLEQRRLLATVTWIAGGGGLWNDGNNWDSGSVPGPADDAVIPDLVGLPTITINASGADVRSITSQERVSMFGAGGIRVTQSSTFAGGLDISGGSGSLRGGGLITIGSTSTWAGSSPSIGLTTVSIIGALTINTSGGSFVIDGSLGVAPGGSIEVIGANPLVLNGTLATNVGGSFSLAGSAGITNPFNSGGINNAGRFDRLASAAAVTVAAPLNNTGTVQVASGTLTLTGGVEQYAGNALTAGTWVANGGILDIPFSGTNITTLRPAATVSLIGPTASFERIRTVDNNQGTFNLENHNFIGSASSTFINSGTVRFSGGSYEQSVGVGYTQSAGVTTLSDGATLSANVTVNGGLFAGDGTVFGLNFLNNALVAPGQSPGILNISGNYTQGAAGVLEIEVQGTNALVPDFDQLIIGGTATLSGTLNVSLLNGFLPDRTESFRILQASSRVGDFATKNFSLRNGLPLLTTSPGSTFYDLTGTAFVVRNTNNSGPFSLRDQIANANANTGIDQLLFRIGAGGPATIAPTTALPFFTDPVVIDATSQLGYTSSPIIELNGTGAGASANGLRLASGSNGSTIQGLVINRFSGGGLWIDSSSNRIAANYIGTDLAGTNALPNGLRGVYVQGSNNTIGGTATGARNVISGNTGFGVQLRLPGTSNNLVQGNYIGTNAAGTAALGNSQEGVMIESGASGNIIGGDDAADGTIDGQVLARNVISGNARGVRVVSADSNVIAGNYIGTNVTGSAAVPNTSQGIFIDGSSNGTLVGGITAGAGNLISGNTSAGISIAAVNTTVQSNLIGTSAAGTAALANGASGIGIADPATGTIVGGSIVAARNIISGNISHGIGLASTSSNTVEGNYIGLDITGTLDLGNSGSGVNVSGAIARNNIFRGNVLSGNTVHGVSVNPGDRAGTALVGNIIGLNAAGTTAVGNSQSGVFVSGAGGLQFGGTAVADRNIISGNAQNGIGLDTSNANTIRGNYIGTDITGTLDLGNGLRGILIFDGSSNNIIGGTNVGAGNVISGNGTGIVIQDAITQSNIIQGNRIGTNAAGTAAIGNTGDAVLIQVGSSNNVVGGDDDDDGNLDGIVNARNILSGNAFGVRILAGNGNIVRGNYIGTDLSGSTAIGNIQAGVLIDSAADTQVGGTTAGAGNLISNNQNGIILETATATIVRGNTIGTDVSGTLDRGNSLNGVLIIDGSTNNVIGGTIAGAGNVISGNNQSGIIIQNTNTTGNVIQGNRIGTNVSGTSAIANTGDGVIIQLGASNNEVGGDDDDDGQLDGVVNARNIISGNAIGVRILAGDGNIIRGNFIGTNATGTAAISNTSLGVGVGSGATNTTIGGTTPGAGNVVSGNQSGITISGTGVNNTFLYGNRIGTTANGLGILSNLTNAGLSIGQSSNTTVGDGTAAGRNIISGNFVKNLAVVQTATNVTINGNFVGPDATGFAALAAGPSIQGIDIFSTASGVVIRNNLISGNSRYGIGLGAPGTIIAGNIIGLNLDGSAALPNGTEGINWSSSNSIIGGTTPADRNIISGNLGIGIGISGVAGTNNQILGNYIGTNFDGTIARPNGGTGVVFSTASTNNVLGGTVPGAGNLVSGNTLRGVEFVGTGTLNNRMEGNRVGTNASGTAAIPNSLGVFVTSGASNTTIGGTDIGAGNLISGNASGILISGAGVANTAIYGNLIGTTANGLAALGNGGNGGLTIGQSTNTLVGDGTAVGRNIISGNNGRGIRIDQGIGAVIRGNFIGTNLTGLAAVPNTSFGVEVTSSSGAVVIRDNLISGNNQGIVGGASGSVIAGNIIGLNLDGSAALPNAIDGINWSQPNTTIGGTTAADRNVISGNARNGITISSATGTGNQILGNFIGTDLTGTVARPNANTGISMSGGANNNTIGGLAPGVANVISGNTSNGIFIDGSITTGLVIRGNFVGTDLTGTLNLGNGGNGIAILASNSVVAGNCVRGSVAGLAGIVIQSGTGNVIGGSTAADRNVVGGGAGSGIRLLTASGNTVRGNYIGTDASGSVADPNPVGVSIEAGVTAASNNQIVNNLISGNTTFGVNLNGSLATANTIAGNFIGTNFDGTVALPNARGVNIFGAANANIVGGTTAAARNIISGNTNSGVEISGTGTSNNTVAGNHIGTNAVGSALPNLRGIRVTTNSVSNTIADNEVRFSTSDNILIEAPGNVLSRNTTSEMSGSPIRLNPATLSPGTVNLIQALDAISSVVSGEVLAAPNTQYTVEIFTSPILGQARRFVASTSVTTNGTGFASFSITPPAGQLNGFVHATLTGIGVGQTIPSTSPLSNGVQGTPAIILGLRSQSPEGTPITLTAFASTNPVVGYLWEVRKDGVPYAFQLRADGTQSDGGIQFTPDDEGQYQVSLRVTLEDGSQTTIGPFNIQVFNVAPTASFTYTPSSSAAGTPVSLTNTSSDPGQLDVLTTAWEVRFGSTAGSVVFSSTATTNSTATFTPAQGGFYYATLTVSDGDGGVRTLSREISVDGLPQSTTIIVPQPSVREGQSVRARAPEVELNRTEQLTFQWRVTKTPASGPSVSYPFTEPSRGVVEFVPDDNGTYTIDLTILVGSSSVIATPQQVVVSNVAPRIQITGAPVTASVGSAIALGSSITDPGSADSQIVTWTVTRDDLPFSTSTGPTLTFTPTIAGVYSVVASATDDDGGIGMDRRVFNLLQGVGIPTRQPETPSRIAPGFVNVGIQVSSGPYIEGNAIAFSLTVGEANAPAVTSYSWRARSSAGVSASGTTPTFSFTPNQGGDYIIELSATFADGRTGNAFLSPLSVLGTAPVLNSLAVIQPAVAPLFEGTPVTIRAEATDARESIGLDYQWALKKPGETVFTTLNGVDGSPAEFRFVPEDGLAVGQASVYVVRVRVTDSQNLTVVRELEVPIVNATPTASINAVYDLLSPSVIRFQALANDAGFADRPGLTYQWRVNSGAFSAATTSPEFTTSLTSLNNITVKVTDKDGAAVEIIYAVVQGQPGNVDDTIIVNSDGNATVNGVNVSFVGGDQVLVLGLDGDDAITVTAAVTKRVVVIGGRGNDTINASAASVPVILDGGQGNDTLTGGSGDDVLIAGPGNNVLVGSNGNNRFVGGGNDTMTGGVNNDYYEVHFSTVVLNDLGGGSDTIDLTAAQAGVTLNLSSTAGTPQSVFPGSTLALNGSFEKLIGSTHSDILSTNTPGTTIEGGAGGDRLLSSAIDTYLDGGDGDDLIDLTNASGSFLGGAGRDRIQGSVPSIATTNIATGSGDDVVEIQGASSAQFSSVSIALGDGNNQLVASRITGKIYGNNGTNSGIDIFGSAMATSSLSATLNSSSNVDIFGSASVGVSTISVTGSSNIDIFGSASPTSNTLSATLSSSSNVDIFGSASTGASTIAVNNGSSNIDIFGSASPNSGTLSATISGSSNIDIFGSASIGSATNVTVNSGSSNIDIFGSASPTGSSLNASINSSSQIDIFGSASLGGNTIAINSGSSDVDIFGSAAIGAITVNVSASQDIDIFGAASSGGGSLTAIISGSSNIDIFGSASTGGQTTITVNNGSSDIDIFGSASPAGSNLSATISGSSSNIDIFGSAAVGGQTTVQVNGSSNIDIFGSASPTGSSLTATISGSSNIDIFGSAAAGGQTTVTVNNGSSNIDIFGSTSPTGSNLMTTVNGSSSNIDIFGSAAIGGQTTVTVNGGSSNIDIFGSASPTGSNLSAIISGSTGDIDIFGSAASGGQTTVNINGSSNIDIFGSASPTGSNLTATINGSSSNIDIFGSAAVGGQTIVTVNNGSSNIDIFGSAAPNGSNLTASISGSSNIDIFGSAAIGGQTTVNVNNGSSNIDIFGSSSPTGSGLTAIISGSSNIDIFGSAATGRQTTVTVDGGSSNIDIFGSASPTGSRLNATVSSSSNVDIFGSASPGSITVIASQDIDIFGSASTGTIININGSSDVDIYGGYGDVVTLNQAIRTRVEGGFFGAVPSPAGPGLTVTVTGGSREVGVFGTSVRDIVDVGLSSQVGVDLRGGDDVLDVDGAQRFVAITDDGVDRITIRSGFDMLIYLGSGADQTEVRGGDLVRMIGEAGEDAFLISGGSNLAIDGGDGNDQIFTVGGSGINVRGDAGEDTVDIYRGIGISVAGGAGADRLRVFGSLGGALEPGIAYASLDGQTGDDQLEVRPLIRVSDRVNTTTPSVESPHLYAPAWMNLPTWVTSPTTTTVASSIALVGGSGNNTLWLEGSQRLYGIGGEDTDTITLREGSSSEVVGGRGNDAVSVSATGSDNRIFGDQGNDTIEALAGLRVAIFGGQGDDILRLHNGEDGFARGEAGDDQLEIRSGTRMVLAGEDGRDRLSIAGGTAGIAAGGLGDDNLEISGGNSGLLLGQSGNDHLKLSGGSQSILSGGDSDDLIEALGRDADLYGDDGDDRYQLLNATSQTLSASSLLRIRELIYVSSTNIEAESRGVDSIDLSDFPSRAQIDLRITGLINDSLTGLQPVIASQLGLILLGSIESLIGTEFDDLLIGSNEANLLDGRGGNDELRGLGGDDILIGATGNDLLLGGTGNDIYVFETGAGVSLGNDSLIEATSGGIDGLDFRGLPVGLGALNLNLATTQALAGGLVQLSLQTSVGASQPAEIEEVVGTEFDDSLVGNDLDNRFELLSGVNQVDGRAGSDVYTFYGIVGGSTTIVDSPSGAGRDTLDFAGFDFPIDLDLAISTPQLFGPITLTLASGSSIENVVGTTFNDEIHGNALDNAIFGGAGRDVVDGRAGSDRLVADLPQVVLLDFDSAFRAERGDYNYSETERAAIMARVAAAYAPFNWMFTRNEAQAQAWSADMGRNFARLEFSKGRGGGVSGDAGEIDFRNIQRRIISEVNVNPLLPTIARLLVEKFGPNYTPQQYSDMVVALTSTIAAHELGHTAGLRHGDAFGPIGTGLFASTDSSGIFPEYNGPRGATETASHIIASPLSVGSTIEDAAGLTFFGEREATKLAFNEIGIARREQGIAFDSHGAIVTAENLGTLEPLTVPNLAPNSNFLRFGQSFNVSAMAVVGELRTQAIAGVGSTEFDFYRFTGMAGDIVNIELLANSIRPLRGSLFDGELRVYKADGTQIAFNDDDFEGTKDATILDLVLPESGEYFISVGLAELPAIDSGGGRYELFLSRFSVGQGLPVPGDTLISGSGNDTLLGSAADDLFIAAGATSTSLLTLDGRAGRDTLDTLGIPFVFNGTSIDAVISTVNNPPTVTIQVPADALVGEVILANFTVSDLDAIDRSAPFTLLIDWGDGTAIEERTVPVGTFSLVVPHIFTRVSAEGRFQISVTAKDSRGATSLSVSKPHVATGWSVMPDPIQLNQSILVIVGTPQSDLIRVRQHGSDWLRVRVRSWEADVRVRGRVHGSDVSRILVHGLEDHDVIDLLGVNTSAIVWAGAGNDLIQGGNAADILWGESGSDIIGGGSGRDILLGGTGADLLLGDRDDDILISGLTAYDREFASMAPDNHVSGTRLSLNEQRVAMQSILSEWTSNRSYTQRRNNILGVGSPARNNQSFFLKTDSSQARNNTVFDDGAVDHLFGQLGQDWFFARTWRPGRCRIDLVWDDNRNETITDIDWWWE